VNDNRPIRVLIVGASGGTGRELVKQALERGHRVTALARQPEKIKVAHERLTVVKGDVMDAASLAPAMQHQDAVLCALGHKRWLGPSNILSQGTRNIVDTMKASNVRRLVVETALGVGDSTGRLGLYYTLFTIPLILPFYWYDKGRQEKVVRESNLDWVIVRPGQLTNGRKRGVYKHGPHVGNYLWSVSISRADTADFMLNQLTDTPYLRTSVGVCY
jgi:putative NADH-flavin reductase